MPSCPEPGNLRKTLLLASAFSAADILRFQAAPAVQDVDLHTRRLVGACMETDSFMKGAGLTEEAPGNKANQVRCFPVGVYYGHPGPASNLHLRKDSLARR